MSASRVDIPVRVGWIILRRVEKSSWSSQRRRIVITIVALVGIVAKAIAD